MLEEYQKGIDRHFLQATIIWPELKREDEDYDVKRQAGKTLNFLVLYMGGAKKFQETLLKDMGLTLSLDRCQFIITVFDNKYRVFRVWQANCIAKVKQQGYLVLPTGWSRTWSTGDSVDNVVSEIADFPIQTISAQIIQSAQFEIQKELLRRRLYTKLVLQIHDAIYKDGPIEEEPEVESIIDRILPHPPLLCHLEGLLGRSVPILYEREVF
jgi:DNA polymerase-1